MLRGISSATALVAVAIAATGCATESTPILRYVNLDSGTSITTDAKQRLVINTETHPTSRPGRVNPVRIVCAEPSPDAASVLAGGFGFGLNILGRGSTSLSGSNAAALVQLAERTATIQLLRDQMYRACEAYANGAISGTEYSLLMSRNNDAMVTLMLGETAARMYGRNLAAASASVDADSEASMSDLAELAKELVEKSEAAKNAEIDATKAGQAEKDADQKLANTTSETPAEVIDNLDDEETETDEEADDTKTTADTKNAEADEALDNFLKAVSSTKARSQYSTGGFSNALPALDQNAVKVAETLGQMQKQFLDLGAEEHLISACVVELGNVHKDYYYNKYTRELVLTKDDLSGVQLALRDQIATRINKALSKVRTNPEQFETVKETLLKLFDDAENLEEFTNTIAELNQGLSGTVDIDELAKMFEIRKLLKLEDPSFSALENYKDAVDDEENSLFPNRKRIVDERLRALSAFESSEKITLLAKQCYDQLGEWMSEEHAVRQMREASVLTQQFIEARTPATITPPSGKDGKPTNNPAPPSTASEDFIKTTEFLNSYLNCDSKTNETEKETCRVEAIATHFKSLVLVIDDSEQNDAQEQDQQTGNDETKKNTAIIGTTYLQLASENKEKDATELSDQKGRFESQTKALEGKLKGVIGEGQKVKLEEDDKTFSIRITGFSKREDVASFCESKKDDLKTRAGIDACQ